MNRSINTKLFISNLPREYSVDLLIKKITKWIGTYPNLQIIQNKKNPNNGLAILYSVTHEQSIILKQKTKNKKFLNRQLNVSDYKPRTKKQLQANKKKYYNSNKAKTKKKKKKQKMNKKNKKKKKKYIISNLPREYSVDLLIKNHQMDWYISKPFKLYKTKNPNNGLVTFIQLLSEQSIILKNKNQNKKFKSATQCLGL
ncbi:hypothetical protein M0813_24681 [Anaeramoeba flamelloides]|uniref:RRM domain-containing protein n=1 Tax=Anaeramoeba flamelloides TaxID=1746091 RepID=A0ABQ8Y5B8_9EUKA|nr:hypothetical protein M0813_24681 [Anaeramoeba flamelloides]